MQFKILVWALVLLGFFWFSIPVLAEAVCGNGTCEGPFLGGNENPCTCPLDCGSCAPSPYEVCHEYLPCEDTNNVCTVILVPSCCGNELCEGLEDFGNCPRDCDPETLDIELVSPVLDAPFARGQEGSFAVKLSSAGRELFDAQILATGFFGTIQLFNDGKHGDGTNLDNTYANYFTVPDDAGEGERLVTITAAFRSAVSSTLEFFLPIKAELQQEVSFPSTIFLGENITIFGTLSRGPDPVSIPIDLNIVNSFGALLEEKTIQTDESGFFSYSFRTSLIDPRGEWVLNALGMDEKRNRFSFSETILVEDPSLERFLSLDLSWDPEIVQKGDSLTVVVTVTDLGNFVNDAKVELIDPFNKVTPFSFQSDGQYVITYVVPFSLSLGDQNFRVRATRVTGILVEGVQEFSVLVEGKEFSMELISPTEKRFNMGDPVVFRVHAEYAFNQPVLDANAYAIINDQRVVLESEGGGFYSGEYFLQGVSTGSIAFEIVLEDLFENKSSVDGQIEVFGVGFNYYIQQYGFSFLFLALVFSAVFFVLYRIVVKRALIDKLEKRQLSLLGLEKRTQIKYFEQAAIDKPSYDSLMESYETERKEIEKKLKKMKLVEKTRKTSEVFSPLEDSSQKIVQSEPESLVESAPTEPVIPFQPEIEKEKPKKKKGIKKKKKSIEGKGFS